MEIPQSLHPDIPTYKELQYRIKELEKQNEIIRTQSKKEISDFKKKLAASYGREEAYRGIIKNLNRTNISESKDE